ncbi:MAG TPA: FAD-linked oxidase C-terminal domain-containing protein [Chloroflexota bacterium]
MRKGAATIEASPVVRALVDALGAATVLWQPYDMHLYAYDGSIDRARPEAVVLPTTTAEVATTLRICAEYNVPVTPRGSGTGLSGGAIPAAGGVLVCTARMNRILSVDPESRRAVVQPGVVNMHLSDKVKEFGLYYVPDPSSQRACSIGGNVAENAGGPHTLLHGVTTNHVLGIELVLMGGEVVRLGGDALDPPGYDLVGLVTGSEGTFGVVTEITVKLTPLSPGVRTMLAIFSSVEQAGNAVSGIIGAGIVPAALEMMDNLPIQAVEDAYHAGYPRDAGAVLLIEIEGPADGLEEPAQAIVAECTRAGAREVRVATTARERTLLWAGRKGAFGALGRITPDYYTMDGVIPRGTMPMVLSQIAEVGRKHGLTICNVFHAGDGNLHPLILFDAEVEGSVERVKLAGDDILAICASVGGSLSGEHGIGMEKNNLMHLIFSEPDMALMKELRLAFDPLGLCNPGKVFPTPGRCLEPGGRPRAGAGW